MAHYGVGSGFHQQSGIVALLHVGMGLEFRSPMEDGHDEGVGMCGLILSDDGGQPADGRAADVWFAFRVRPVFYREGDGVEECHFHLSFPHHDGSGLFFHCPSVAERRDAGFPECVVGVGQSLPALVYGVVVGQGGVGDARAA